MYLPGQVWSQISNYCRCRYRYPVSHAAPILDLFLVPCFLKRLHFESSLATNLSTKYLQFESGSTKTIIESMLASLSLFCLALQLLWHPQHTIKSIERWNLMCRSLPSNLELDSIHWQKQLKYLTGTPAALPPPPILFQLSNMAPLDTEAQFKFLIACIKNSNAGKVGKSVPATLFFQVLTVTGDATIDRFRQRRSRMRHCL